MNRKLVVYFPALSQTQEQSIQAAALARGFEALFARDAMQAKEFCKEAEILFGSAPEAVESSQTLRWVCAPSAGINQYSGVFSALSRQVLLSNSSGAFGVTIAEHILMFLLIVLRRQPEYRDIVRQRQWQRDLPVRSILGSRVVLLGTGDIGRETALRLRAFSPESLVGVNRSGKNPGGLFDQVLPIERLDEALHGCDLLILSLPGTEETRHILDKKRLAALKDGAVLVNVGRGNAIDEAALESHLRAGRLFAALDVFEQEPLPKDSTLWGCPNLYITPHAAGNNTLPYTVERKLSLFLEDFGRYCEGLPLLRQVDIKKGY